MGVEPSPWFGVRLSTGVHRRREPNFGDQVRQGKVNELGEVHATIVLQKHRPPPGLGVACGSLGLRVEAAGIDGPVRGA